MNKERQAIVNSLEELYRSYWERILTIKYDIKHNYCNVDKGTIKMKLLEELAEEIKTKIGIIQQQEIYEREFDKED